MERHEFEEKVAEYARRHGLLASGDNVVVALSGGADSVALLRVLLAIGVRCNALHCNFGLRGAESDRDEAFVRELCGSLDVPLDVIRFDVVSYEREHKVSTEMACRELRYAWFAEKMEEKRCAAIAVAHHHDDNVETFFLNMLRGSGIQGLAGIKPRNGNVIRPLLCVTRLDIERYLTELGQSYVTDSTNKENDYKRNKVRNVLLPLLNDLFPEAKSGLNRTLDNVQSCNALYQHLVNALRKDAVFGDTVKYIDLKRLDGLGESRETALYEMLREFGFNSEQVRNLCESWCGGLGMGRYVLSKSHKAVIAHDKIEVIPLGEDCQALEIDVNLQSVLENDEDVLPIKVALGTKPVGERRIVGVNGVDSIALSVSVLKADANCVLRHWHEGDRIRPFGMKGSKLVSDLFSDAKYSESQKREAWLLCIGDEIVWVLGLRASRCFKVEPEDGAFLLVSRRM